MQTFILASQSPRRKTLLEWAELPFEVIVSASDENYPDDLPIEQVPEYIAKNKAIAVQNKISQAGVLKAQQCIIAADTIVVLGNKILGKPISREDAIQTLQSLSGKSHKVITGVSLLNNGAQHSFSETTEVVFHTLSQEQIEFYVDKYKPFDKAGAYGIQEWIGVVGIKSIIGDFYNVMGLPVSKLLQTIKQLGIA
jgi:septum formation protein